MSVATACDLNMWIVELQFFVPGIPAPGGSKRAFTVRRRDGSLGVGVQDAAKRNKPWRSDVAVIAGHAMTGRPLLTGPLMVQVEFVLSRPKGHFGTGRNARQVKRSAPVYPASKPDATKLWRAAEDALTGIVWRDDSQIVQQIISKTYGHKPGMRIVVESLHMGD